MTEQPDPNRKWWTPREVSELFCVHITTVYVWIKVGKLPVTRISRNLYRIRAEDVRKLEAMELKPTTSEQMQAAIKDGRVREVPEMYEPTAEELEQQGHLRMGEGE